MKLYTGNYFDAFADEYRKGILNDINSQSDAYILNVNIDDYTTHLFQTYQLDVPEFHFEKVYADSEEQDIYGSRFPHEFFITDRNQTFRKEAIIYHIPYTGNINLLQLRPNPFSLMSYDANFNEQQKCLLIEVINFYNDPVRIKQRYDESVRDLSSNYGNIQANCKTFNEGLTSYIKYTIDNRKQQLLQKSNLLASLGVPIKKKDNIPQTFAVPNPKLKEKIIVKPVVHEKNFKPEPALDDDNYRKILKIINDVGKNFERLPSTYTGKSEEDIRDHILLILDPNFELGSAGGETFNKVGKTDVSLRYDSSVVFVAECKYWKGEKVFLQTIDQLLSYLTWRNSKVAVINFVQNKEFSDVLTTIAKAAPTHPNFVKALPPTDETWFNYKFHLNGDRNREIDLAVISFHLPK
ncbi:MAG: hypothetical protein JWQ34_2638 [Mucilaginibacter sp.]|uniref:hypothetical protein n=1 Tax=Mucilaginibacter sp. TaxID=1882438 RepID=UPI0026186434|nr:hypothetical protein [Mucilaginibacter sp.]MDB5004413.1 hypothetical protein [Mucilaginibacter sp.]